MSKKPFAVGSIPDVKVPSNTVLTPFGSVTTYFDPKTLTSS